MFIQEKIALDYNLVREKMPLVLNITNYVAMNFTANALLAIGASPIMAHAEEEIVEMTQISSSLTLNIGTLSKPWIKSMLMAGITAREEKIPIVFDPVGVGATHYRQKVAIEIIKTCYPNIIRGNAAEIGTLCSLLLNSASIEAHSKGVDSLTQVNLIVTAAKELALKLQTIIIISGEFDYIISENKIFQVCNGDPLMTKVTALGCAATSIIGAFAAVQKNIYQACISAMTVVALAGEKAKMTTSDPGHFQVHFIDALYDLGTDFISTKAKVIEL